MDEREEERKECSDHERRRRHLLLDLHLHEESIGLASKGAERKALELRKNPCVHHIAVTYKREDTKSGREPRLPNRIQRRERCGEEEEGTLRSSMSSREEAHAGGSSGLLSLHQIVEKKPASAVAQLQLDDGAYPWRVWPRR